MKIKYYKNNNINSGCPVIFDETLEPECWSSYYKDYRKLLDFREKNSDKFRSIVINDRNFNRNSSESEFLRTLLELNKKDRDKYIYLIVLPTKRFFESRLLQKCFQKSRGLINKKYFFLDRHTYEILSFSCISQEKLEFYGI